MADKSLNLYQQNRLFIELIAIFIMKNYSFELFMVYFKDSFSSLNFIPITV
jgi:hypothetical protein